MIILKVTKKHGPNLSLEDIFLKNCKGRFNLTPLLSLFRVKGWSLTTSLLLVRETYIFSVSNYPTRTVFSGFILFTLIFCFCFCFLFICSKKSSRDIYIYIYIYICILFKICFFIPFIVTIISSC